MITSYNVNMSWEEFVELQSDSPVCELFFMYNEKHYTLMHSTYFKGELKPCWLFCESEFYNGIVGVNPDPKNIVAIEFEKIVSKDYYSNEKFEDMTETLLRICEMPVFSGKSFHEVIENVVFSD